MGWPGALFFLTKARDLPGRPANLEVQPGTPFLFTIDNGEPHVADGSHTTYLAPIHDTLGHSMVRLAAYAPDAAHTLQAEVGYVDLSGDWMTDGFQVGNFTDTCGGDPESFNWTKDILLTVLGAYGHFSRQEGEGAETPYVWVQDASLPEGDESVTIRASARVTMQDVQLEYSFHIPEQGQSRLFRSLLAARPSVPQSAPGATAALSATAIGVAAFGSRPLRRKLALAVGLAAVVLGLTLAGCEMLTDFWGDIYGRYTFRSLEYLSEDFSLIESGDEVWRLSEGEGLMALDLTTVVTDFESGEETHRQCLLNVSATTGALIMLEDAVTPEDIRFD